MTHHLDKPLRQRMAGVYVAEATNIRRLSAEQHRVSAFHVAALSFVIGVIAGMLIGALVTL
jgi:quinol-cytochrome oxidoreductase complex cytochrome b subunit